MGFFHEPIQNIRLGLWSLVFLGHNQKSTALLQGGEVKFTAAGVANTRELHNREVLSACKRFKNMFGSNIKATGCPLLSRAAFK